MHRQTQTFTATTLFLHRSLHSPSFLNFTTKLLCCLLKNEIPVFTHITNRSIFFFFLFSEYQMAQTKVTTRLRLEKENYVEINGRVGYLAYKLQ